MNILHKHINITIGIEISSNDDDELYADDNVDLSIIYLYSADEVILSALEPTTFVI